MWPGGCTAPITPSACSGRRAGRGHAEVAARLGRARPGRAASTAGPGDLPQTAAGRQPAAAGPPPPPDHRLRPVRAHRADPVHCLLAYSVQLTTARVAVHSLAGCFFYGAFTAKVLLVQSRRLPGWALPAAGGALAILVAVLWYTSALWYYNGYQLP